MKNVLKKLAVCLIAMAMLLPVRAVLAPDVSAEASDFTLPSHESYKIIYMDGSTKLTEETRWTDYIYLSLYTPTKEGYVFNSWNTKANGTGTRYYANNCSYAGSAGSTLTLYAQWTKVVYTIAFDGNGSTSGSMSKMTNCNYGSSYTLNANQFKRTGYTFAGWNTAADGSGTTYTDKASVKNLSSVNGSTVTLYAQWTAYKFYLVLDGNGSTSGSYSQTFWAETGTCKLPANVYKREGYAFYGWNTAADGSGTSYGDEAVFTYTPTVDGETLTLYAQWTAYSYQLVLDGNGSTSGSYTREYWGISDVLYTIPANVYERTGYTFTVWNVESDGSGKSFSDGSSLWAIPDYDGQILTLYAQWTPIQYTIKFDGNGSSSGSMDALDARSYGTSYKLTANKFKKTGYTFAGWNTKKDGSGKTYKNKASVKNLTSKSDGTVTLYAQWTPNKYTISFDGNGSTSGSMSDLANCKYASSYKLTANKFKKTGYTFAGWNTKKDGSGKTYKNKASVKKLTSKNKGTVTLYAQWTAAKYSITYVLNGGTNSGSNPSSYTYGKAVTLKDPTRSGYTFQGWYTDKNLTKSITKISEKTSGKLTLYAGWKAKKAKKTTTTCTTCGGKGTVKCKKCGGSKTTETKCDNCHGLGYTTISGQGAEICSTCGGSGTSKTKCTTCKGKGKVTCSSCGGSGTKK
jgi:uncharacterized repeat protein (TIGR02543 family)